MSRARNIKPGFFKNDQLAECHPLARILFAGLWCEADREGRLEDRPKRLKAECLPYDECNVDALLEELASRGFILRYKVGTAAYIAIVEFLKHQNPHVRELASAIPGPSDAKHNLGSAQAQPGQFSGDEEHGTGPALSPSPQPLKERVGEPRETVELPPEVEVERWQSFYDQLASDGKLSISRVKTAVLQLHRVIKSGHDPNAVLTAAVMRGLRDLEDTANRLAAENSKLKTGSSHGNAVSTSGRKLSAAEQVQQAILERRQREGAADAPFAAIGH